MFKGKLKIPRFSLSIHLSIVVKLPASAFTEFLDVSGVSHVSSS